MSLDCNGPLIEDRSDITLSSSDPNSHPEYALLNSGKAWCTKAKEGQYLEVCFVGIFISWNYELAPKLSATASVAQW